MYYLRYIGFIRVDGEIFRLPNCKHFSCGYTKSHVINLLKDNLYEVFNKRFLDSHHIEYAIRDMSNDNIEFIDAFLPF